MNYRPLGSTPDDPRLGRFIPDDWKHVEKYPYSAIQSSTVSEVNRTLRLPRWHWSHNQGRQGSCVGHGAALERALVNTEQNRLLRLFRPGRRYDPIHIWNAAKAIDYWPETNPGDDNGTSVRAAYDVLRTDGARPIKTNGVTIGVQGTVIVTDTEQPVSPEHGVQYTRWATTVDEIRTAISNGQPVTIGVNWYANFDRPVSQRGIYGWNEHWVAVSDWGPITGGHCVTIYAASDKRQAFKVKNSWGRGYPLIYLPYVAMQRLLNEDGEAALTTDR